MTRRFQVSLRTSIVLTLVASAFLGANVMPQESTDPVYASMNELTREMRPQMLYLQHGWPSTCVDYLDTPSDRHYFWNYEAIMGNVAVLLAVLAALWAALGGHWHL
jgi:hypothetical protein